MVQKSESEVCCGKNAVLESIGAYYSMLLWLKRNATLLQAEPSESFSMMKRCIAMDTTLPVPIMRNTPPTIYFSGSLLFAWKQSLLLLHLLTLPHRSVSWIRQTTSTTGRGRTQLDVWGVLHQMGWTDCLEALWDQRLICNDGLDLVAHSLAMANMG